MVALLFLFLSITSKNSRSDILVTEFFSTPAGRILRFDEENFAESVFALIPGNPGLSGSVYNPTDNRLYVSALQHGGIYVLDSTTGQVLAFHLLGFGPAGLSVDSVGNVYVTDFTSNLMRVYNPNDFSTPVNSVSVPGGVTTGVGLLSNGDAVIATAGAGVFRYDGNSVTSFTAHPLAQLATSQVAVDSDDNVYIGHGIGFSDLAFKFSSSGSLLGTFEVTDAMVGGTGQGSTSGTSPSGVAIDREGNVIIAALGRSNPGDPGGERGGVFRFNSSGAPFVEIASQTKAFSSATVVPNATVVKSFVFHPDWAGLGSSQDSAKTLYLETGNPQVLGYDHLINSVGGVRGVGFLVRDFADWDSLSLNDFEFQMSPEDAFSPGANPPATWAAAPPPSEMQKISASPDQILFSWSSPNLVENRWLRITMKANPVTGLLSPRVYYVGHLLGEIDGEINGIYTVSFADISLIRGQVGNSVTSSSIVDINKSGTVSFADITDMRNAVGKRLPVISVP